MAKGNILYSAIDVKIVTPTTNLSPTLIFDDVFPFPKYKILDTHIQQTSSSSSYYGLIIVAIAQQMEE